MAKKIFIGVSLRVIIKLIEVPEQQFLDAVCSKTTLDPSTIESWLRRDNTPSAQQGSINKLVDYLNEHSGKSPSDGGLGLSEEVSSVLKLLDISWFSKNSEQIEKLFSFKKQEKQYADNDRILLPDGLEIWPNKAVSDEFSAVSGVYYLIRTIRPEADGEIRSISFERLEIKFDEMGLKCTHHNNRKREYYGCVYISSKNLFFTLFRSLDSSKSFSHRSIIARYRKGVGNISILGCLLSRVTSSNEDPASYVSIMISKNIFNNLDVKGFKARISNNDLFPDFLHRLNSQMYEEYAFEKGKSGAIPSMRLREPTDIEKIWSGFDFNEFINKCRIKDQNI